MIGFNRDKNSAASDTEFVRQLKMKFIAAYTEHKDSWNKLTPLALEIFMWLKDHLPFTQAEKEQIFPAPAQEKLQADTLSKAERKKHRRLLKWWGKHGQK